MASKKEIAPNKYKIRFTDHQRGKRTGFVFNGNKIEAEKVRLDYEKREINMKQGFKYDRTNTDTTIAVLHDWFFSKGLKWKNLKREKPIKALTVSKYHDAFHNFSDAFGSNCPIENLDSTEYREFFAKRKLNGLNVDIRAMKSIINVAIEHKDKIVKEMPTELFKFKVKSKDPYYLELEQVNHILNTPMDEETYEIFSMYLYTGCRLSGLLTLTWDRVDFNNKTIKVIEKADKERTIYVPELVNDILMKYSYRSQPMGYSAKKVGLRLAKLSKDSGIRFTSRVLRSTCGSFMLSSGCSIEQVAEHLGHENIQTTRKWYARIIKDQRQQAMKKFSSFVSDMVQSPVSPYISATS